MRVRPLVKALLGLPIAALLRWRLRLSTRQVGIVVLYHRISHRRGDPARERMPALDADRFESHVRHLKSSYRVVSASELVGAAARRRRGERVPVAITFDDDLPDHVRTAAPVLSRHRVTATFFLCGASLERPFAFWWERLQRAFDEGIDVSGAFEQGPARITEGELTLHRTATAVRNLPAAGRSDMGRRLGDLLGPDPVDAGIRAKHVRELKDAGFEIGFHTREHPVLTELGDAELDAALRDGRAELEAVVGEPIDLIAYPYGEVDQRVAVAARSGGYRLGFTTERQPVRPSSNPLLLGRYEPELASLGIFAFEVARALSQPAA